ncbi:ABC transporter ATP-binding protein [Desulfovibrio sp. Fe33]|uniref:ABC transporter ATP-binding protein n=1 Tax=Desulfovibrio sp. Fe33 TaxID=3020842 RepID=UPI00234DB6DF|nr:ABC transporter ATP-binding protein [Desulfovibrio sp. Fe33]
MIKAENISKTFNGQGAPTKALVNVSLTVEEGEFVSVVGRSGSGKTTLLHILSTLQKPDSGSLVYNNADIVRVEEGKLNTIRHKDFAVIFQFHHLLPYLTVLENALLPFMNGLRPVPRQRVEEARQCLERVGLGGKWNRLPSMLSGGEQQRAAIARALVKKARCLFADEPTGSLDKATGEEILRLLKDLNKDGLAVVMVTHDPQYAAYADTVVEMEDGAIKSIARQ